MKRIEVAAGILLADDRVLISERLGDAAFDGLWEFPGGKIEAGEAPADALLRELREELGVDVLQSRFFTALEHQYPDRHVRLEFFLVSEWQGEPIGQEGQALRWVPLSELEPQDLLPADAPLVAELRRL